MNMKKNIFLLVMAALAVGCSNEELVENEAQPAIGFQALTSGVTMTRANETNGVNIKDNPFEVYAFTESGKSFMGHKLSEGTNDPSEGVEIVNHGGKWDYANPADKAYWPIEKLDFYAFHPKQDIISGYWLEVASSEKQVVWFALSTAEEQQIDLMYAISRGIDRNSNDGKVKVLFRHALSQACFKVKTELESMSVDIEDLKIHNYSLSGALTLPNTTDEISLNDWKKSEKVLISYEPKDLETPLTGIGTEAKVISSKLYIPQALTKWNPEGQNIDAANKERASYLSILCKIRQNGVYLWGSEDRYVRLFVPFGVTWEPGKRYVYTLIFGGGYDSEGNKVNVPIDFEVEEEAWKDTPYDVDSDTNVDIN